MTTQTFDDTGQIIDTGWWDFVNNNTNGFGGDGNESINWNAIGVGATRSGSSVPEPSTWAMMLVGFAGLGYAAFRTRKSTVAALTA